MSDPSRSTKIAIVTLGCGRNEVDSANAAGLLAASGYEVVDDPETADAVVVNTCAFIETKASTRSSPQTARARVPRQPRAITAAVSVSRTARKVSCSGQNWPAGW